MQVLLLPRPKCPAAECARNGTIALLLYNFIMSIISCQCGRSGQSTYICIYLFNFSETTCLSGNLLRHFDADNDKRLPQSNICLNGTQKPSLESVLGARKIINANDCVCFAFISTQSWIEQCMGMGVVAILRKSYISYT